MGLTSLKESQRGFPEGSVVKNLEPMQEILGRYLGGGGRSPRVENGNPFQYPCLGNPMDRGAWQATVHRVTKSWTRLSTHIP